MRRVFLQGASALVLAAVLGMPTASDASPLLQSVEREFQQAIQRVVPATVICRPWGVSGDRGGFSSGVIVSPDGLVLSDGDAGLIWQRRSGRVEKSWQDDVEIRMHRQSGKGARVYRAKVLFRDTDVDTALLRITDPVQNLPFVPPGQSDDVRVGDFALALGSTFQGAGGSPPTLTVGLVSAFTYLEPRPGSSTNKYEFLFTSAAFNDGVNGGPCVDLEGRLIGTISTYVDPDDHEPFQFLAKTVPIERIRQAMAHVGQSHVLDAGQHARSKTITSGRALEEVFHDAGHQAYRGVVSITVNRRKPISRVMPLEEGKVELKRYTGPVSGVSISADGEVITSLYNLTNISGRARPLWRPPPGADVDSGLSDVTSATIHYPNGQSAPARLVGHDLKLGVALLRADLSKLRSVNGGAYRAPVAERATSSALERGRFVLAVGNPYGAKRAKDPLVTMGVLSKRHPDDAASAWRGQWQTDAPGLDSNVGGAAVDIEGRLVGLMTLWHPARHGRNSGISFVIPWPSIEAGLPGLRSGQGPRRALLGVEFRGSFPVIGTVVSGSAAESAGLRPGDRVRKIDSEPVTTVGEAVAVIAQRFENETVRLEVERGRQVLVLRATLQAKP